MEEAMETNRLRRKACTWVAWVLAAAGVLEAGMGLCQVAGLCASRHALYLLTGSFYNPGPYSGFLAVCLPVCLGLWMERRGQGGVAENVRLGAMLLVASVLPAGMSRAAWVAAAAGCACVAVSYGRHRWLAGWRRHRRLWALAAVALTVSVGAAGTWAYHYKKDSADGRLLMWKVAARAVAERPLTGVGWDGVAGAYGEAQEAYFRSGRASEQEKRVAGSPEYVFNEYLQAAMAWGIPVAVLLVGVAGCALWGCMRRGDYGLGGALVALAVFSFASYPFQFPEFVGALALLVAAGLPVAAGGAVLAVGMAVCSCQLQRKAQAAEWERSRSSYWMGRYEEAVEKAERHYADWRWNARFVFEYGHALHRLRRWDASNRVLEQALRVSGDPMVLNIIGKNCQEAGRPEEAERWLLRAACRLPGRIYPYYLLARLYASRPDVFPRERLEWAVGRVVEEEPKVESSAVREMRSRARKLLGKMKNEE